MLFPIPIPAKCVVCIIMLEGQKLSIDLNFHQLDRELRTLNIHKVTQNCEFGIKIFFFMDCSWIDDSNTS